MSLIANAFLGASGKKEKDFNQIHGMNLKKKEKAWRINEDEIKSEKATMQ